MKLLSVTLFGLATGIIWQGIECEKEFDQTFTILDSPFSRKWDTYLHHNRLRSALLHITDDGDFQHLSISYCYLTAKWVDERGRIVSVTNEVNPLAKDIADLFDN